MAQSAYVMAFRKRLKILGYKDIHIYKIKGSYPLFYAVSAVEPLADTRVSVKLTTVQMHFKLRKDTFQ